MPARNLFTSYTYRNFDDSSNNAIAEQLEELGHNRYKNCIGYYIQLWGKTKVLTFILISIFLENAYL